MTSSQSQYARVKKHLVDTGLTHTEEWLDACYKWISESHPANQLTDKFVQNTVYEQWIDMDLEEMSSACLPPNLKEQRKVDIPGIFALQVNCVQDIGESAYSQFNKIKKLESENTDVKAKDSTEFVASWQPKPRRCLYMTLTDGSQKIYGMEMELIAAISLSLNPGSKILIFGPVICRRGILHLTPKNLKVLGGVVEELLIQNSAENILARALQKPQAAITNSQPERDSGVPNSSTTRCSAVQNAAPARPAATQNSRQNSLQYSAPISAQNFATRDSGIPYSTSSTTNTQRLVSLQPSFTTASAVTATNNSTEEFNSSDDEIFLLDENDLIGSSDVLPSLTPTNEHEVVTLDDTPEAPKPKVARRSSKLLAVSKNPYQYIKQIKNRQTGKLVYIKGIISTLTSNIQVDKTSGEWKLCVNINDGSGYLIVRIAPVVLDKIIGFSPSQMKQLKSSKSAADKVKVKQGMSKLTNVLVHFSGMMQIKICDDEMLMTEMSEITNDHVHALLSRTSEF